MVSECIREEKIPPLEKEKRITENQNKISNHTFDNPIEHVYENIIYMYIYYTFISTFTVTLLYTLVVRWFSYTSTLQT